MGFTRLDTKDLITSIDSVASTTWSNYSPTLTSFYTSSNQVLSNLGQYYLDVYQTSSSDPSAEVQFSIAYCDASGSGSLNYNPSVDGYSPSRTNYGQYRNLILGDELGSFVFGGKVSSYFYVFSIERARYKERLMPGTLTLGISGSNGGLVLTDDSLYESSQIFKDAGRKYELVSGSAGDPNPNTSLTSTGYTKTVGSYGWFLPDIGLILLNGRALDETPANGGISLGTLRSSGSLPDAQNPLKIINALNLSSKGITLNSEETLSSNYVFIRARNEEYNYSENPSFISGSNGEIIYSEFINNPKTYITTVGLYNDNQELLAVAKLSRPLLKDFTKELLIRCKLSF